MPSRSTYPDIEVPNVDIWGFLFERKDLPFPEDKTIFTDPYTKRSYTYASTKEAAITFGKGLLTLWDWQKGDVLALFTPNSIDTPIVTWGALWAGGVVTPANPGYTAEELAFQLKDSGAKAIVTQLAMLNTAIEAAKKVGIPLDRIILIGDDKDKSMKFKYFSNLRPTSGATRFFRKKARNPKTDLAYLVYSSGTTGHPKGVMLSHTNIVSNCLQLFSSESEHLTCNGGKDGKGDILLAFLPFFHIYGLNCLLHQTLYSGLELVVMPKFDIENFCRHIQDYKITFAYVVPPVVLQLAKHPVVEKFDLSSMRMMNSGAAPLTKELVDAVYSRLKIPVKQGYGLSETSPTTHTQRWQDWDTSIGSVGRLLANQVAMYMSDDGTEVPTGQVGELWIKGPNIFLGYLNNEAGTKNALTSDGYFKTGDVGYQDADGNFYITDRVKELIKYKGFQVPPAELEGLLASHPDIDDVAVIGVYSDDHASELPRAYIVPKQGVVKSPETEKRIMDWLAERVANHKKLRGGVRFIDEVPKSASGKILRRLLRDQVLKEEENPKAKL